MDRHQHTHQALEARRQRVPLASHSSHAPDAAAHVCAVSVYKDPWKYGLAISLCRHPLLIHCFSLCKIWCFALLFQCFGLFGFASRLQTLCELVDVIVSCNFDYFPANV